MCGEALDDVALSSQTVQTVLQNEEDSLFDLHMSIIQVGTFFYILSLIFCIDTKNINAKFKF